MGSSKQAAQDSRFDGIKWLTIIALLVGGLWAHYQYAQVPLPLRTIGWLVLLGLVATVALQTRSGRHGWTFVKEARAEVRKVVWPNRQETVQATLMVTVMVTVVSLILWGVDALLMWAIGHLAG